MKRVNILGAGLAGLAAASYLAGQNIACVLISRQISERAQSVLAEGGINAALDLMGEQDTTEEHFADTLAGGADLADPVAVRRMTDRAPDLVREMAAWGVPFSMRGEQLLQRHFGGQKKRRTLFCKSSTGKALMTALIDNVRRQEETWIRRYPHHELEELILRDGACVGIRIRDLYTDEICDLEGPVILACGGMAGLFPGATTGTVTNNGDALAKVFAQGVEIANPEMIQYHPTTVGIAGKRMLISEAARGEGGRLYILRNGSPWYFMEEKYPELGNLMPRDIVTCEIESVLKDPACEGPVYLDMTGLTKEIWKRSLPDLRKEVKDYLRIDPAKQPVPVGPGIHYFMGGVHVDVDHRTSLPGLYAAGECACQYHGANRLGGNSLLGAIFGGQTAARTVILDQKGEAATSKAAEGKVHAPRFSEKRRITPEIPELLGEILCEGLSITRDETTMRHALEKLDLLRRRAAGPADRQRIDLGEAMLRCALARKESRGAHRRRDYPERNDAEFRKTTVALRRAEGEIEVQFREIGETFHSGETSVEARMP